MAKLIEILEKHTAPGELFENLENQQVRCAACAHRCVIPEGASGTCKVRFNRGGVLQVPYGYVAGVQCDPVEKKPFFHARPGARAFSFGMLGCDLHCSFCQNWITSQTLRDPSAVVLPSLATPEELVRAACAQGAEIVVSTYNEPLITSEWSRAVFKEAKTAGLMTAYVSNGNATPEVLDFLKPWLDLYKVDLKGFDELQYRKLGGRLQPVLETIRRLAEMGIWVEIVTLLIPGFNDSEEELTRLTEFVAGVSPDLPWHITAFHRSYKMTSADDTEPGDLIRAAKIGKKSGLRYIYAGNLPGKAEELENTFCPQCKEVLIERRGYRILSYRLTSEGRCPKCANLIPGRWSSSHQP
jgi:pyruvate formate lyase activating enzyme